MFSILHLKGSVGHGLEYAQLVYRQRQ